MNCVLLLLKEEYVRGLQGFNSRYPKIEKLLKQTDRQNTFSMKIGDTSVCIFSSETLRNSLKNSINVKMKYVWEYSIFG